MGRVIGSYYPIIAVSQLLNETGNVTTLPTFLCCESVKRSKILPKVIRLMYLVGNNWVSNKDPSLPGGRLINKQADYDRQKNGVESLLWGYLLLYLTILSNYDFLSPHWEQILQRIALSA